MQQRSDLFSWSQRPYGRIFNNLTLPDSHQGSIEMATITGDALMAAAASAGAHTAIFDSRNQWFALHDSSVCWKHPSLGARDLVAEIMDAADRYSIQYIPYIPVDCDRRAFDEHPDWRNIDADGKVADMIFPRVCENTPFKEFMAEYLKDLLTRYPINGLWFDGLGVHKTCYCRFCREGFAAKTDREVPLSELADPETWKLWIEYKQDATLAVFEIFAAAANSVRPGIPIHTAWESGVRTSSQSWVEAYWKWATPYLQMMRSDTGKTSEFYVLTSQYAPSYPITLSTAEIRDRAMTSIANGAIPTFTLTGVPARIREVNAEIEARAPWLEGADPVPYVAVVHSERSRRLCEKDAHKDGPDFTLYGTVMALLEEKIPETCVSDFNIENDDLSRYAAIILPDIGIITDPVADRLRTYVAQGGGLVASSRTSLCADDGSVLPDFRLADLFGVHYCGEMPDATVLPSWYRTHSGDDVPNKIDCKFLKLGKHPIIDDVLIRESYSHEVVPEFRRGKPEDADGAYPGPMFQVEAEDGVDCVLTEEFQTAGTRRPMIAARAYGKGRVVYVAANLGFHYASHWSYPYVRRLQANAVRWAAGDQNSPLEIDSLLQVHATLYRQEKPNRLIVHLMNAPCPQGYPPMTRQTWGGHSQARGPVDAPERDIYFTSFGRMREDVAPVHDIRVRLRGVFTRIYTAPDRRILPHKVSDGWTEVIVPRLNVHLMVVAEI